MCVQKSKSISILLVFQKQPLKNDTLPMLLRNISTPLLRNNPAPLLRNMGRYCEIYRYCEAVTAEFSGTVTAK